LPSGKAKNSELFFNFQIVKSEFQTGEFKTVNRWINNEIRQAAIAIAPFNFRCAVL